MAVIEEKFDEEIKEKMQKTCLKVIDIFEEDFTLSQQAFMLKVLIDGFEKEHSIDIKQVVILKK